MELIMKFLQMTEMTNFHHGYTVNSRYNDMNFSESHIDITKIANKNMIML